MFTKHLQMSFTLLIEHGEVQEAYPSKRHGKEPMTKTLTTTSLGNNSYLVSVYYMGKDPGQHSLMRIKAQRTLILYQARFFFVFLRKTQPAFWLSLSTASTSITQTALHFTTDYHTLDHSQMTILHICGYSLLLTTHQHSILNGR